MNKHAFNDMPLQSEMIAVKDVVIKDAKIRVVKPDNEKYIALVEDLKVNALQSPIIVRETTDMDTGSVYYELSAGGHRLAAFKQLGKDMIPAFVLPRETTKLQMLGIQFRENSLRVKQTPAEEGNQFERMMAEDTSITAQDLAILTGYSVATINDRLHFSEAKLKPEVLKLVENGAISLDNARELSKAGKSLQNDEIIESAKVLDKKELKDRISTTKKALFSGEDVTPKVKEDKKFEAKAKFRGLEVVTKETETKSLARVKYQDPALQEAFSEGVAWAIGLDIETISEQEEAFNLIIAEKDRVDLEKKLAKQRQKVQDLEAQAAAEYGLPTEEEAEV